MLEKQDLVEVRSIVIEVMSQSEERIKADFRGELKSATDGLHGELKSATDELRGELRSTTDELRGELKSATDGLHGELKSATDELRGAMRESEERIVSQINREITDLAEINRAVIAKVSVIPELEQRLLRLEQKLGIVV